MKKFELVMAGGGLTAARAIKSYRDSGSEQIALLSKERDLPYHRPALSKRYLRWSCAPCTGAGTSIPT